MANEDPGMEWFQAWKSLGPSFFSWPISHKKPETPTTTAILCSTLHWCETKSHVNIVEERMWWGFRGNWATWILDSVIVILFESHDFIHYHMGCVKTICFGRTLKNIHVPMLIRHQDFGLLIHTSTEEGIKATNQTIYRAWNFIFILIFRHLCQGSCSADLMSAWAWRLYMFEFDLLWSEPLGKKWTWPFHSKVLGSMIPRVKFHDRGRGWAVCRGESASWLSLACLIYFMFPYVSSLVPWPWLVCKTDWPNGSSKDNMAQQKAKDGRVLLGWARVTNIKTSTPLGWYVGLVPFIYTT